MTSEITIGDLKFINRASSVRIESSWKLLTSFAIIQLPNLKRLIDGQKLEKVIKVGDAVEIKLGYDGILKTEFTGYVTLITPKYPLEIRIEDKMWQLKQTTITHSWASITLKKLLTFLVPAATINCPDVTLSPFRIDKASIAKVLQRLKEEYLFTVYFRGEQLYAGLTYGEIGLGEVDYHFQQNANQEDLSFRRSDDKKLKIKGISVNSANDKIEYEAGDDDGHSTTLHYYNKTKTELKSLVNEALKNMKFDGYQGSLSTRGLPYAVHGMVANLYDDVYPERQGRYFIDSVTIDFNENDGFKRTVELGRRAA